LYPEWYIIDAIILLWVTVLSIKKGFKKPSISLVFSILFLIILILVNIYVFGFNKLVIQNLMMYLMPLTLFVYMLHLKRVYTTLELFNLIRKITTIFNIYFFLNTILIIVQIYTNSFMMQRFLSYNSAPFDHMDGLIGMNGVNILNFVWIATILLNLNLYFREPKFKRALLLLIQVLLMLTL
ncbi:hypothetical protein CHH51_06745, partial [Terribacillus saccharophilus]